MSKHKEILEGIKALVFGEDVTAEKNTELTVEKEAVEVTEEKESFVAATLSDGTLIQIEPEVQVGASVLIEDPEQGFVPVPDGSYELEDGRIIVVAGGVLESMEEVAEAEEEAAAEEMETETKEEPVLSGQEIRKIIESVETHFNSVIKELKSEIETFKADAQAKNELFVSALEELNKQPVEEPKQKKKTGFNINKKKKNIFIK